jgi:hypothetical protein
MHVWPVFLSRSRQQWKPPKSFDALMATFAASSMGSAHISPITQSKFGYLASYKTGAQSMLRSSISWAHNLIPPSRCDAKPDNLDAPGARRRKDTKTAFLVTCFDPGTLWDDFGIRSDVIVSPHLFRDRLFS